MNHSSTVSKRVPSWKRFKTQYFALASGVVLAASAGLAFIPGQSQPTPGLSAADAGPGVTTLQLSQAVQPRPVVYFVDSEAARDALLGQGKEFIFYSTIDTTEASEATRELLATNSDILIVNLMGQSVPAPAIEAAVSRETQDLIAANITAGEQMLRDDLSATTSAQRAVASEADLMGGVISTEYATWGAPTPASAAQPATASEADLMGGVISTERATWGAPTADGSLATRPVQPPLLDTYVYLVASEEKRVQLSSQFADEDATPLAFGIIPTTRLVIVAPVGSPIEAELASASSPVADAPSVHVIDAR